MKLILGGILIIITVASFAADNLCVNCHKDINPGIIDQLNEGKMGQNGISCDDCHGNKHSTAEDYKQATMPTSQTCGRCHYDKFQQFNAGKHHLAWFGMKTQAAYHNQPSAIVKQGYRGCSGCHKIGTKGLQIVGEGLNSELKNDDGKELAEYRYGNAQCDACHTRHSFKKSEAQDPRACSNCHMGFDHPQWEMYMSSKHGIIWDIEDNAVNGRTPTCQTCHMPNGNHAVVTSWGFLGLRVPSERNVRALIETNPSINKSLTKLADTLQSLGFTGNYIDLDDDPNWVLDRAIILQATGILDADLQPTQRFIDIVIHGQTARGVDEFNAIRESMKTTCLKCHAKDFVDIFFQASDTIVKKADHEFAKAIKAVQGLYADGILAKPENWEYAPDLLQYYDAKTEIEQELFLSLLEYRQRAFQGAFHDSKDYMHWYGWSPLKATVNIILDKAEEMRIIANLSDKITVINMPISSINSGSGNIKFIPTIRTPRLQIDGTLTIDDSELIGKIANIIVVIAVNDKSKKYYNLQNDKLILWNGNFDKLVALQNIILQPTQSITILNEQLNIADKLARGNLDIYLGMKIDGKVLYFPESIEINISNSLS